MLDDIDKQIIDILLENSRVTNLEIADQINRSESTVRQRIKKLIDENIIRKFSIIIDPFIIGKTSEAYVGIKTKPNKLLKIIQSLKEFDEIKKLSTTTGDYMIVCEIWTEKGEQLAEIIERIEELEGVIEVLPSIIQEKHKFLIDQQL